MEVLGANSSFALDGDALHARVPARTRGVAPRPVPPREFAGHAPVLRGPALRLRAGLRNAAGPAVLPRLTRGPLHRLAAVARSARPAARRSGGTPPTPRVGTAVVRRPRRATCGWHVDRACAEGH